MGCMPTSIRPFLRILATIGLLLIILLSTHIPPISPDEVITRSLNLNMARDFNCMESVIPADTDVLFAAAPGTPRLPAQYYRSQFFLAPRLVVLPNPEDLEDEISRFDWIIETNLKAEPFPQLNERFHLTVIKDCDYFYVLHKTSQP